MSDELDKVLSRIKAGLVQSGLSQKDLADRVGLSQTQMSRMLSGGRKLSAGELGVIAAVLGTSTAGLLGEKSSARPAVVAARVGAVTKAPVLDRAFDRAQQLLQQRDFLSVLPGHPTSPARPLLALPKTTMRKDQGDQLARELRQRLDLDSTSAVDLDELAELFRLDVSTELLPDDLHGVLVTDGGGDFLDGRSGTQTAVALINAGDTLGRRRFTLAHELGHLLFGDGELAVADFKHGKGQGAQTWTQEKLVELRADCFAAQLLVPDEGLRILAHAYAEKPVEVLVSEAAATFEVSFDAARRRLATLELLSEQNRLAVVAVGATRAFAAAGLSEQGRHLMSKADLEPPAQLLEQALLAYQSSLVGLRVIAELYGQTPDRFAQLEADLREAGWAPEYETVPG